MPMPSLLKLLKGRNAYTVKHFIPLEVALSSKKKEFLRVKKLWFFRHSHIPCRVDWNCSGIAGNLGTRFAGCMGQRMRHSNP